MFVFFDVCMPECMCVHQLHAGICEGEGIRAQGTGVANSCDKMYKHLPSVGAGTAISSAPQNNLVFKGHG